MKKNNAEIRQLLGKRGIKPEELPAEVDIKKLQRRVTTDEKKIADFSQKRDE